MFFVLYLENGKWYCEEYKTSRSACERALRLRSFGVMAYVEEDWGGATASYLAKFSKRQFPTREAEERAFNRKIKGCFEP